MKIGKLQQTLQRIISYDYADQTMAIMVTGAPGGGKTQSGKWVANNTIWPVAAGGDDKPFDLIICHPVGHDSSKVGGYPTIINGEAVHVVYGDQKLLRDAKRPTICIVDDFGQVAPSAQAAWQQLYEERSFNGCTVSPFVRFLVLTNRKEDGAGVQTVLSTIQSRCMIINAEPDVERLISWLAGAYPDVPEMGAFLAKRPGFILDQQRSDAQKRGSIENSPCSRTVEYACKVVRFKLDAAEELECLQGAVGKAMAAEFAAFRKVWRNIVPTAKIIADPDNAPVPTAPDLLYAECGSLVHASLRENIAAVGRYVARLPEEFQQYFYKLLEVQRPALCETQTFIQFKIKSRY